MNAALIRGMSNKELTKIALGEGELAAELGKRFEALLDQYTETVGEFIQLKISRNHDRQRANRLEREVLECREMLNRHGIIFDKPDWGD